MFLKIICSLKEAQINHIIFRKYLYNFHITIEGGPVAIWKSKIILGSESDFQNIHKGKKRLSSANDNDIIENYAWYGMNCNISNKYKYFIDPIAEVSKKCLRMAAMVPSAKKHVDMWQIKIVCRTRISTHRNGWLVHCDNTSVIVDILDEVATRP